MQHRGPHGPQARHLDRLDRDHETLGMQALLSTGIETQPAAA
jgi:hypothetical protein